MNIKNIFSRKNKTPKNKMTLDEKFQKGLVTFEEVADEFAVDLTTVCINYYNAKKEFLIDRVKSEVEVHINTQVVQRGNALGAAPNEIFRNNKAFDEYIVSSKRKILALSNAQVALVADTVTVLKNLMNKYGNGYNKVNLAKICLKNDIVDKLMADESIAYYTGPFGRKIKSDIPSMEDMLRFIDLCEAVNESMDGGSDGIDDNGLLVDKYGNPLEDDPVKDWPMIDYGKFEDYFNREGKTISEKFIGATGDEKKKVLKFFSDEFIRDARAFNEYTEKGYDGTTGDGIYSALMRKELIKDGSIIMDYVKQNFGEDAMKDFMNDLAENVGQEIASFANNVIIMKWDFLLDSNEMFDDDGNIRKVKK